MEKWFLIENHLDQREMLAEARIIFTDLTVEKPEHIEGIAFPAADRDRVLQILGLTDAEMIEKPTERGGVFLLGPVAYRARLRRDENMQMWEEIWPIADQFAKLLEGDIWLSNPHGERQQKPKREDGTALEVFFWSRPDIAPRDVPWKRRNDIEIFGIELTNGQLDGCKPSGKGIQISDGKTVVAELHGRALYVLFDLPHGGNAGELMEHILINALPHLGVQREKYEKHLRELEAAKMEVEEKKVKNSRAEYVRACMRRVEGQKKEVKSKISEHEQHLKEISVQIIEHTRKLRELQSTAEYLERDMKELEPRFLMEYEKLLVLPHVKKVLATPETISVFTDTIFLEFRDKRYELGDYQIYLPTDRGGLRIVNLRCRELTGQTKFQHPHVFNSDGSNVCLGNIREGVHKLIGEYQYAVAAQILIEFLHRITDEGDYPRYLTDNWKPLPKTQGRRMP